MARTIGLVFIIISIAAASSASSITVSNITSVASTIITQSSQSSSQGSSTTTPSSLGFLSPKPPSSYEVTENIIDIPDDRPKPSIVTNFTLFKPLNLGNINITINKVTKNDTGDENHQPKKTSITFVHIYKENREGGLKRFFKGIKDYVYGLKRGVVDGLHKYFHKDDEKLHKTLNDDDDFHNEFHKTIHSDENYDDYEHEPFYY